MAADHKSALAEIIGLWTSMAVADAAEVSAERIALCLDAMGSNPVDRATGVIEAVLADLPRGETVALILADHIDSIVISHQRQAA